ncbi:MAG: hypothetical protein ABI977_05945 [Acidobacteriota bacterium]
MLLAALAVTAAPAQPQNRKAVFVKPPLTKDIKRQPREIARKPAERVLEVEKTRTGKTAELRRVREGIAVGEPTGVSPKKEVIDATGGKQRGIAVGEPNGRIKRKPEEKNDAPKKVLKEEAGGLRRIEDPANFPKKLKEASDGPKRQRIDQGPLTPATDVPQRTKDAVGSPQRADQKIEGKAKFTDKKTDELRKKGKLDPQDGGKGAIIERKPKEEAADFAKKKIGKAKVKKIDAKLAEKEASLIRRRN